MNSKQLEILEKAVRKHLVNALTFCHKKAKVGDNLLELGSQAISYAKYNVTALHWDTTNEPKGELRFYQEEEGAAGETENYPVTILETDKLIELLASLEVITGHRYYPAFVMPERLSGFVKSHGATSETPLDFTSAIKQKGLIMIIELIIAACNEITGELEGANKNDPQVQNWDNASDLLTKVQVAIAAENPVYDKK